MIDEATVRLRVGIASRPIPVMDVLNRMRGQRGRRVQERIKRLNPKGVVEGSRPYGWNPGHTIGHAAWMRDLITVRRFIALNGREVYRALPREAFMRSGHRKAIRREWVIDFGFRWRAP